MEAHSETQPSWLRPTSVGFATSARAKCAFIVLQKINEPGGHPRRRLPRRQLQWEYPTVDNNVNRYFSSFNLLCANG